MKKRWLIPLIAGAVVVFVAFGVLTMTVVLKSYERDNVMGTYLEPYETKAVEFLRQDQEGISKNSPHSESTESFPSFVTKNLRIGSTIRAVFCLD